MNNEGFELIRDTMYNHLLDAVELGNWGLASKLVREIASKMNQLDDAQRGEVNEWMRYIQAKCKEMAKGVAN